MSITFSPNERVLCYHGPLMYEAKILKTVVWDESTSLTGVVGEHYFVHYKGWKQTWDEWVPGERLLKFNEINVAKQKALTQQAHAAAAAAAASSSKSHAGSGSKGHHASAGGGNKDGSFTRAGGRKDGTRGTKRGREEDESSKKPDMKLNVPEVLKVALVDDWEAVTKNTQLVTLPRSPNVVEILDEFQAYICSSSVTKPPNLKPEIVGPTIVSGLQVYFDRSLGANLLYRFERPQYAGIRKQYVTGPNVVIGQEKDMSAIYGAEHLLRMLVSLPQMVANSTMDPESVALVRDYVNELLDYMAKERERLFQPEYESSSLQYQSISRS